ncbi:addiction module protein [Planctopirus limnophila]|nr:addiction module protein [Planctopirus limnophila]
MISPAISEPPPQQLASRKTALSPPTYCGTLNVVIPIQNSSAAATREDNMAIDLESIKLLTRAEKEELFQFLSSELGLAEEFELSEQDQQEISRRQHEMRTGTVQAISDDDFWKRWEGR